MILDSSKIRAVTANKSSSQKQSNLDKALIDALQQRNTREVQSCLEAGANPNQTIPNSKESLINYVIRNSNITIAELLIKYKVNLEVVDSKGNTPFLFSVQNENMKMIKLLANHANIDAQNNLGFTSLMYAVQSGSARLTNLLCHKKTNLDLKNINGKTVLALAREKGNDKIVQELEKYQNKNNNVSKPVIKTPVSTPKKSIEKKETKNKKQNPKKQTRKEKTGPLKRLLIGFSQGYAKKYPASSLEWSLKKKNQHAQEAYMSGVLPDLKETWYFQTLSNKEIQGDTGTNAFLPPESVENVVKNFEFRHFEAYVHYQPKQKLANRIEAIYKHLGYLPEDYKIDVELESETATEKELSSDYVMTYGHGTTEIFDTILEQHIKNKRDSIIVPTPTYGLFIPLMRNHCKIITLPSTSENSGEINPYALKKLIEKTEKENIEYYKDYFYSKYNSLTQALLKIKKKSDFDNFTKLINAIYNVLKEKKHETDFKKTDILSSSIEKFNQYVCRLKKEGKVNAAFKTNWLLEPVPRVRALYFINPSMPSGKLGEQAAIDKIAKVLNKHPSVNVIEDVTHRGIVLKNNLTTGSFTKTSVMDRTLILDGISKIFGLARARASILIGHRSLITPVAHSLHMRNCTLNGASNAFLNRVYKLTPEEFKNHLNELSRDYQKRLNLLKAVLFGLGDFSKKEFEKIKGSFYASYEKESKTKKITDPQKQLIFSGIDNVKLYCEPEAGYFVLIDLSAYVGQYIGAVEMRTGMDFRNAFYNLADVNSLSDVMCYDSPEKGKAYIRYALSIDSEIDMVEGLLRMKKVLAQCKPTAMEIPNAEINIKHSSPRKKDERKKIVSRESSSESKDSEPMPHVLDKPAQTFTLLKDMGTQKKKKETEKEKTTKQVQSPRVTTRSADRASK